jgi:hypothetical protein
MDEEIKINVDDLPTFLAQFIEIVLGFTQGHLGLLEDAFLCIRQLFRVKQLVFPLAHEQSFRLTDLADGCYAAAGMKYNMGNPPRRTLTTSTDRLR